MFYKNTGFSSIDYDDSMYVIKARHGALLSPFSESIVIGVTATSSSTCMVKIKSSSRSVLNLLNFNANKDNIEVLKQYISNEVYKLMQPDEIKMKQQMDNTSEVRITPPNIKFK